MRFLRFIAIAALALTYMLICAFAPARAEKRVALVVGNSANASVAPLRNPANDARLIADTLRGLGFTLTGGGAQIDLDKAGLDRAVQSFGAQSADVALFYFAGHGIHSYSGAPADGLAWTSGSCFSGRVLRGGSWGDIPGDLRAAARRGRSDQLTITASIIGFRLARTLISAGSSGN